MILLFYEFLCYSFLGFLLEVFYARLLGWDRHGRKCQLILPICPVYGLGAAAILHMPPLLQSHPAAIFISGGLLATLTEYAVGAIYLWGIRVRFWDYSQSPGNISGLICPLYTFYWGLLSVALVQAIHPVLAPWLVHIPAELAALLFPFFAGDALISLWLLHRFGDPDCLMWYTAFLPLQRASM